MKTLFLLFIIGFGSLSPAQELSLELAKKISARAMQYALQKSWKISVAVVNSEGNLVYFERGDDAYVGSISSSREKAESANAFQRPTSKFVEAIHSGKSGIVSGKNIVAIEGGVPIIVKGKQVGAVAISGAKSTEDEEVANESLKVITEK